MIKQEITIYQFNPYCYEIFDKIFKDLRIYW